ncbi:hypothetical protein B5F35_08335 [Anaeromassilibacillus sp. An200]|nr:hypothetical protein B5F35_08335 [Anaeromassilibacillus sp. An200]
MTGAAHSSARPPEKLARNVTKWQGTAQFVSLKRTPFLKYNHHAEVFPQGSASFFLPEFLSRVLPEGDPQVRRIRAPKSVWIKAKKITLNP